MNSTMLSRVSSSLVNGNCQVRGGSGVDSRMLMQLCRAVVVASTAPLKQRNHQRFSSIATNDSIHLTRNFSTTSLSLSQNGTSSNATDKVNHFDDAEVGHIDSTTTVSSNGNMIVPRTTRRSGFSTNGRHNHHHHRNANGTANTFQMNQFVLQQFKPEAIVPVQAIHAAQTIDLSILSSSAFQQNAIKKQMFGKNSVVIQLADHIVIPPKTVTKTTTTTASASSAAATGNNGNSDATSPTTTIIASNIINVNKSTTILDPTISPSSSPRYMAVFRFGSIVYFNVEDDIAKQLTCLIKKIAAFGPVPVGLERKENFGVIVTRDLDISSNSAMLSSLLVNDPHSHGSNTGNNTSGGNNGNESLLFEPVTGDYCMVPELDMNGVAVIGTIMGQTVTLDSYSDTVEELLTNFARINSTVTQTGSFTSGDKSFLFKTVAQNNSIFIDMISKVRIKDRSDTAWNLTKYETIHYGMKEEFELDDRFENIEFKLNLIHNNAKFFLEVMHHQKANNLEWIIVILILAECILMCIEMSGYGESFFRTIFGFTPFYPPSPPVSPDAVQIVTTSSPLLPHQLDVIDGELHLPDDDIHT